MDVFTNSNAFAFNNIKGIKKFKPNVNGISTCLVKKETLRKFEVKKDTGIGLYGNTKFMIPATDFNSELVTFVNRAIRIAGLNTDGLSKAQIFTVKIVLAMNYNKGGYEKIIEGLKKGYLIIFRIEEVVSEKGKPYKALLPILNLSSVGPLGEGYTNKFYNPNVQHSGEFGENVGGGRLVFENTKKDGVLTPAANKLVARETKLGLGKQQESCSLGSKDIILFDETLNPNAPEYVKRALVLGTAWVSAQDFINYGPARIIPFKAVTAPMPESMGVLKPNEVFVGGNTHKSKLNGVLYKALNMSHEEISKLTEVDARKLLKPFEFNFNVFGEDVLCYKFKAEIFVTNFYVLYGLEGVTSDLNDNGSTISDIITDDGIKGFYNTAIDKVAENIKSGASFNLVDHVNAALTIGEVKRKPRVVGITSAEIQQVAVSYGYTAACSYIDSLVSNKTVEAKAFLTKGVNDLPVVNKDVLFRLGSDFLHGEIDTTILPHAFVEALIDRVGEGDFIITHKGYNFPFMGVGSLDKVEKDGDYIKDPSAAIVAVVKFIISLRFRNTDWALKYDNHCLEINSLLMKKIQILKARGAYLPAVTGYWLSPTEIFSNGDKDGLVVAAKLPILFDQAVTSLDNSLVTPYNDDEMNMYGDLFKGLAFVSPEFFLSQENDGDGDLIKVMSFNAAIPLWRGQPSFTAEIGKKYQQGEWDGLKLTLKPYAVMPHKSFHFGNVAAKTAKDNVAIMAANEYRVKESMLPFMENGSLIEKELATMIAEASAYLVQYEAMRAAKHDGAVSAFDGVRCSPNPKEIPFLSYVLNWSDLLQNYFGYTCPVTEVISGYDFVPTKSTAALITLLFSIYDCDYSRLLPFSLNPNGEGFQGFLPLNVRQASFGLMQNGYSRTIGGYVGAFDYKDSKAIADALTVRPIPVNVVYTQYLNKAFSKVTINQVSLSCSPFVYFLHKIVNYIPTDGGNGKSIIASNVSVGPSNSNGVSTMNAVSINTVSSITNDGSEYWNSVVGSVVFVSNDSITPILTKALVKLKKGIMNIAINGGTLEDCSALVAKYNAFVCEKLNSDSTNELENSDNSDNCVNTIHTTNSGVDSCELWNAVVGDVTFIKSDTDAAKSRLINLKRSIMRAANNNKTFELALIEANSYVMDYNEWVIEYLSSITNNPVEVLFSETVEEVSSNAVEKDVVNVVAEDFIPATSDDVSVGEPVVEVVSNVSTFVDNDFDSNNTKGGFKCATKAKSLGSEPLCIFDDGLPSSADMRTLKYETRRFVFEDTVNRNVVKSKVNSVTVNPSTGNQVVFKTLSDALVYLKLNVVLQSGSKSLKVVRSKGGFIIQ